MGKDNTLGALAHSDLAALFEHLDEGLILASFEGSVVHWNRGALEMHGLESMEQVLIPLADFQAMYSLETLDGAVLPFERWPLPRILAGERVRQLELRLRRVDRDWWRFFSYSGSTMNDAEGRPKMAVLHVSDVTARKTAEVALREAAEHMKTAQRVGRFGTFEIVFDDSGAPIEPYYASDELLRIYGLPQGENAVMLGEMGSFLHPDEISTFDAVRKTLTASAPEYERRYRIIRRDGEIRHVRLHARVFFDGERQVRMVGTARDFTEEEEARQELLELQASLERRVSERTAELAAVNAELESFAYAVSHDLRAPLRAIAGFSRALVEDAGPVLGADARDHLDEIMSASRKMGELIDALLHLSRCTRGEIERVTFDLGRIAERVVTNLQRAEPERKVAVTLEPGLEAVGDPRMIELVLENLLSNAWKYTGKNDDPVISVGRVLRPDGAYFYVKDNGAGFSMSHVSKLFLPFQRLHRQDEFPGLGIGLATALRIVKRHGGKFFVEGAVGKGATFGFSLPEDALPLPSLTSPTKTKGPDGR
jgi:PAS domain S-box-containing protein